MTGWPATRTWCCTAATRTPSTFRCTRRLGGRRYRSLFTRTCTVRLRQPSIVHQDQHLHRIHRGPVHNWYGAHQPRVRRLSHASARRDVPRLRHRHVHRATDGAGRAVLPVRAAQQHAGPPDGARRKCRGPARFHNRVCTGALTRLDTAAQPAAQPWRVLRSISLRLRAVCGGTHALRSTARKRLLARPPARTRARHRETATSSAARCSWAWAPRAQRRSAPSWTSSSCRPSPSRRYARVSRTSARSTTASRARAPSTASPRSFLAWRPSTG